MGSRIQAIREKLGDFRSAKLLRRQADTMNYKQIDLAAGWAAIKIWRRNPAYAAYPPLAIYAHCSVFRADNAQTIKTVTQGTKSHPKYLRGCGTIEIGLAKRLQNHLALDPIEIIG